MATKHYKNNRYKREKFISGLGESHIVDGFVVDNGHKNGLEVHSITDNGIIIVHNLNSGELVTKLIARPQQIKRYYESTGRETPEEYDNILRCAEWYHILGFNKMF